MGTLPEPKDASRYAPRAVGAMAGMFDGVSRRYDLLNRLLSLGQDRAWRAAMWHAVPESARTCLDLCTGSGASLLGLLRPGRLVLGMDASLGMLAVARDGYGEAGWAPRLACADAFQLPLADGALDAITVAFGVRNLRPRPAAIAELARVLRPAGVLVVLEAVAPRPGPMAPLHRWYLRHLVPLLGRLSSDPSAYQYLSESIFEFGEGDAFERDLVAAGFDVRPRRRFLFGATSLWQAQRGAGSGEISAGSPTSLQDARSQGVRRGHFAQPAFAHDAEWRAWTIAQLVFAVALVIALARALAIFVNSGTDLPLESWQRGALGVLIVAGLVGFAARSVILALRLLESRPRG